MNTFVASLIDKIKPSATIAVSMKAAELKRKGHDIIGLGAGEPDFDTPEHIKRAAIKAIDNGETKYTAVDGTPELKKAIIKKLKRDNSIAATAEQLLVSCGAKHSIFNLLQAVINPGDEVIIPAPYWVSYPDMVTLSGGTPCIVQATAENYFKVSAQQISEAVTSRTKLIILNAPSNPTGMAYTRNEMMEIGALLREYPNILLCTDDIYEHIYWGAEPLLNYIQLFPEFRDRIIIINGVSKSYAMTGWRIGYALGHENIIKAMRKVQSQSTSNPCSISQAAAAEALSGSQECLTVMCAAFKKRHDYLVSALNDIPGFHCMSSDGAFYAFPDVSEAINMLDTVENDIEFASWLLEKAGVAVVPGTPFGAPGYVRLSFATGQKTLQKAMNKIKTVMSQ